LTIFWVSCVDALEEPKLNQNQKTGGLTVMYEKFVEEIAKRWSLMSS